MLELKEYQRGALDALVRWLETLENAQRDSETMVEALLRTPIDVPIPDELRNYPKAAWKKLKENGGVAATADIFSGTTGLRSQSLYFRLGSALIAYHRSVAMPPC